MVKYQRYYRWKKREEMTSADEHDLESHPLNILCENSCNNKKTRPKLLLYLLFLSLLSCCFILTSLFFTCSSTFQLLYSLGGEDGGISSISLCSFVSNGTICCDRSSIRSDICMMKGDVRTDSASSSLFLYRNSFGDHVPGVSDDDDTEEIIQRENIRPYTRKWEANVMNSIDELKLVVKKGNLENHHKCDVQHDVPAVFFSTGGYTGNVYHEFNDGIIPLYITSQKFNKKVVFVILEYHDWWISKYGDILSHLTDYPAIDYGNDKRTHCFPEAIVGLRIHDELAINTSLVEGNKTIKDFRDILDRAYMPRIRDIIIEEEREAQLNTTNFSPSPSFTSSIEIMNENKDLMKPKLAILSRNDSRAITNEDQLVRIAEEIGFEVEFVRPDRTLELAKVYRVLNSSDVMIGVHGAAMTHFLFMKPGSVFIQVIPLGTDWAAETYYGKPAMQLGLKYTGYKILPRESSLYEEYKKNDPVLIDPDSVNDKGWEFTKKIYLDRQNVRLDIRRFHKHLLRAYYYTIAKKGV